MYNHRCVWVQRLQSIRTRMPYLLDASTVALRQESFRQTRLDRLWSRQDSPPGQITQVELEEEVDFFTLFPGGQWLFVILGDGRPCLRRLHQTQDLAPTLIAVKSELPVRNVEQSFWVSSATDESAIIALCEDATNHS